MGLYSFRKIASLVLRIIIAITVLFLVSAVAIGQAKPEPAIESHKGIGSKTGFIHFATGSQEQRRRHRRI